MMFQIPSVFHLKQKILKILQGFLTFTDLKDLLKIFNLYKKIET